MDKEILESIELRKSLVQGPIIISDWIVLENISANFRSKLYVVQNIFDRSLVAVAKVYEKRIKNNEGWIMRELNHPNIAKLYDFTDNIHQNFLVMEYIDGLDLLEITKRGKSISERWCRFFVNQILLALLYAQSKNIAHRDLKLENIMLTTRGEIKVIDWEFAEKLSNPEVSEIISCGSPHYYCPQIIQKQPISPFCADVWSLGISIYGMLVGRFPFEHSKSSDKKYTYKLLFKNIVNGNFNFKSLKNRNLSNSCINLIERMLNRNANERITLSQILEHDWIAKPLPFNQNYVTCTCELCESNKRRRVANSPSLPF